MKIFDYFSKPRILYHGTRLENLASIQKVGLCPESSHQNAVFLSSIEAFAAYWGNLEVLISVPVRDLKNDLLKKGSFFGGEYEYAGTVPPEVLRIKRIKKF